MKVKKPMLVFSFLAVGITGAIQAQDISNNTFGKGLKIISKDSSFYLKANLRFQILYNGQRNLETDKWNDNMMVRRMRFKAEGYAHNPKFSYKLELGLSNRDNGKIAPETNYAANIILDAVLKYKFFPNWEFWIGQTKLPGNRERVISSQKLQFVDRSQLNSKYNLDRGTGIQLHHKHKVGKMVLKEAVAVTMGEGRNYTKNNVGGYEFTGRIDLLPFGAFASNGDYFGSDLKREEKLKVAIGVTYDQNNNTTRDDFLSEPVDQKTIFVDAMTKSNGFSTMFEYVYKKTENPVAFSHGNSYQRETGINVQAGYLFKNNFEIAARYTGIQPEDNNWSDDYSEITLGLSRYIVGHSLKVQSDLTYIDRDVEDDNFRIRVQVELAF